MSENKLTILQLCYTDINIYIYFIAFFIPSLILNIEITERLGVAILFVLLLSRIEKINFYLDHLF